MAFFHEPVLVAEVIASLACRPGGTYLDGTLGGGGHARAILAAAAPGGLLIGIDADREAIREAESQLASFGDRALLIQGRFADMDTILDGLGIDGLDGILLDLGVSSHQLDTAERGFSFALDAPLDMRMNRAHGTSARDLIHTLPVAELTRIIRDYGEEFMAPRIARAIVARRTVSPLRTTAELAALIARTVPRGKQPTRIHPATKTFQALRIAVNDELDQLRRALAVGIERLNPGGRFCAISFHSLEDRMIKSAFRAAEKGCLCPPDLPRCACGRKPLLRVLTRKPILPGEGEVGMNPRSRSAKLRTAERL
jgi:16S rRNA (cytosine1402-N4)-methyltransferase